VTLYALYVCFIPHVIFIVTAAMFADWWGHQT